MTLFDPADYGMPTVPEPAPPSLLERQKAKIARGIHPLSEVGQVPQAIPLAGDATCGDCLHRRRPTHRSRAYPKCDAGATTETRPRPDGEGTWEKTIWPRASHSETTDCRSWWASCPQFEAKGDSRG